MSQQLGQPCQTTEQLMKTFVTSQKQQDVPSQETPVGEVSVQVDLFSHPGTGEQKVSVKILAANDLRWQMQGGAFKPFVEVHLIGPYLADKKRKYATTTKSGNWAPKFNETFHFFLGNEGEPEHYELMFQVKDYCLTRADRIVGVGVLQLSNVVEQGEDGTSHLPEYTEKRSCAMWVQLGQRLHIDETGLILLRILSQRQNDSVAKEFVRLKSECRFETESTLADVDATNQLMIESCCEQPYHIQYTYLHEHLFQALCTENEEVRLPDAKGEDSFKICQMYGPYLQIFFDDAGQEIVDKFARRYGIEEIYQGMTHFACLCTRYMCAGVPAALSTLLANINAYYADTNAYSDRLASSNFGKDRFVKLIDELHNNLQVELSMYRKYFPSEQPAKLQDLKSKVDLLTTIDFFRMKVLELASPPRASNVVKKCVKLCMQATYKLMFESCCEQQPNKMITANSVQFWFEMIDYLMRAIEEDKNIYSNLLNQLPQELNVGQLCAGTMWRLYKTDLKLALEEHTMSKICETREYMNLYFRVNGFYFKYVDEIQQYKQSIPEFSAWFAPFFMDWLQENDEHSMDILRNAYNRDKSDNFPQISDTIKFSNSVVDVFSQLQEALKFLKQMDCPNPEVYDEIMRRFSKTLNKVLLSYADMVQKDFPRFASNATVAFILMNNVQQLSVQLENIYLNMGGAELDQDTNLVIEKLQKKLESVHDNLSEQLMATLVFPEERED